MFKLLSDRVEKIPPSLVSSSRYEFLSIGEAEPDFGIPPFSPGIIASDLLGVRRWLTTGAGLKVDASGNITVDDTTVPVDTTGFVTTTANTLHQVLLDLDSNIGGLQSTALTAVTTDTSLSGDGRSTSPLSVVKWANSRTITLDGDAGGSVAVDGSSDVTLTVSIPTRPGEIGEIISFNKTLTLTTDWQDTGIRYDDLATGTYMVQLLANDAFAGGRNNHEYYSGIMSWYSSDTESSLELPTDEIVLHRAGGSGEGGLYLRTFRTSAPDPDRLKLQIYSNQENTSAANYVFKFRKVM